MKLIVGDLYRIFDAKSYCGLVVLDLNYRLMLNRDSPPNNSISMFLGLIKRPSNGDLCYKFLSIDKQIIFLTSVVFCNIHWEITKC